MPGDLTPDAVAELRLIRAEIAALRSGIAVPRVPRLHQHRWLPGYEDRNWVLPERHYQLTRVLHNRIHRRAAAGSLPASHISKQRRLALWLALTAGLRTAVWVLAMLLIVLYWCGVTGTVIHWFIALSGSIVFVTFISLYCNAATDGSALTASIAALFSADSHAAVVTTGFTLSSDLSDDFTALESDIARLADMTPGAEASALASSIRQRLNHPQGSRLMADLTAIRNALAAQITAGTGLPAVGDARDQVSPPVAVILPGTPYVKYDISMGPVSAVNLRLRVLVLVSAAPPVEITQQTLDAYLGFGSGEAASIANALETDPTLGGLAHFCHCETVDTYGQIEYSGVAYFGARISLSLGVV